MNGGVKMQLYGITLVLLFVIGVFFLYGWSEEHFSQTSPNLPGTQEPLPSAPPPFTSAVQAQLAASHGFQYLVSYTNQGFEPSTLTVKKGETVRFTNNSSEGLWIAAVGASGAIYPAGDSSECGQSAFDSCNTLNHGEFWEFTFTTTGTWSYHNNTDPAMTGTIIVQ